MRTIKFRAWDTRQKCMQTWEFLNKLCPFEDLFKSKLYSPLMQYTGLTDENIKDVYEGDIIKRPIYQIPAEYCGDELFVVEFNHCAFREVPIDRHNKGDVLSDFNIEVIGNIYENPELLES